MKRRGAILLSVKIAVDVAMAVLFLLLMGYHLFENFQHEWIGASVFVLFIAHNVLNWRWYKNLFKGRYNTARILQTTVNFQLWVVMLCNIASAFMLSRDVFHFLGLMNGSVGRRLHMVSTVWTFLLLSVHLGLHWQMFIGIAKKIVKPNRTAAVILKWIFRIIAFALCCYGSVVFAQREIYNEMFLLVEFKFMDFDEPKWKFFIDYFALMSLFVCIGYYLKKMLTEITSVKMPSSMND